MKKIFAHKSNQVFWRVTSMVTIVASFLLLFSLKILAKAWSYSGIIIHKIKTACSCLPMVEFFKHPVNYMGVLLLGAAVISFLAYSFYRLFQLIVQTKR